MQSDANPRHPTGVVDDYSSAVFGFNAEFGQYEWALDSGMVSATDLHQLVTNSDRR